MISYMRVATVGPLNPDDFADNVTDTLRRMGHEVLPLGAARPPLPSKRLTSAAGMLSDRVRQIDALRQKEMRYLIEEWRPEVVISTDRRLHPITIKSIHAVGAKVGLWFPDSTATMSNHAFFLAGFDRIYLKNPHLARDLANIQGLPVYHLSEAANSSWHRSTREYGTEPSVVMAGNVHPTRALLLDRLIRDGVPIKIYGVGIMPSWIELPRVRAACTETYLARQNKADTFRSARAVLNNLHPAEAAGMNCRLFEAAGSGAAVVSEIRPGLSDLFVQDREVFSFASYDQLLTILRRLLEDPKIGRPVADAAAERTHRDHTYEKRLDRILGDLS